MTAIVTAVVPFLGGCGTDAPSVFAGLAPELCDILGEDMDDAVGFDLLVVFFDPEADDADIEPVRRRLEDSPDVAVITFVSQTEALGEFRSLFRNSREEPALGHWRATLDRVRRATPPDLRDITSPVVEVHEALAPSPCSLVPEHVVGRTDGAATPEDWDRMLVASEKLSAFAHQVCGLDVEPAPAPEPFGS